MRPDSSAGQKGKVSSFSRIAICGALTGYSDEPYEAFCCTPRCSGIGRPIRMLSPTLPDDPLPGPSSGCAEPLCFSRSMSLVFESLDKCGVCRVCDLTGTRVSNSGSTSNGGGGCGTQVMMARQAPYTTRRPQSTQDVMAVADATCLHIAPPSDCPQKWYSKHGIRVRMKPTLTECSTGHVGTFYGKQCRDGCSAKMNIDPPNNASRMLLACMEAK